MRGSAWIHEEEEEEEEVAEEETPFLSMSALNDSVGECCLPKKMPKSLLRTIASAVVDRSN